MPKKKPKRDPNQPLLLQGRDAYIARLKNGRNGEFSRGRQLDDAAHQIARKMHLRTD